MQLMTQDTRSDVKGEGELCNEIIVKYSNDKKSLYLIGLIKNPAFDEEWLQESFKMIKKYNLRHSNLWLQKIY